jgi:tRNA A-37 threonylcarbamoyl transferase component Bud32
MSNKTKEFCLAKRGLVKLDQSYRSNEGNLNKVQFYQDQSGHKFCLRVSAENQREVISNYLTELYNTMGLFDHGGVIAFRSVAEQVKRMRHLRKKRINVPHVVDHGRDWILMSFVEGIPLNNYLSACTNEETKQTITMFLQALYDAHNKGQCLWDRWGANELVHEKSVTFIDFDLSISFPDSVSKAIKCSHDLAIAIRACLQFSAYREGAYNTIFKFMTSSPDINEIYDLKHLSKSLNGQVSFYDKRYCHIGVAIETSKQHKDTNEFIIKLQECIETVLSRTKAIGLDNRATRSDITHIQSSVGSHLLKPTSH